MGSREEVSLKQSFFRYFFILFTLCCILISSVLFFISTYYLDNRLLDSYHGAYSYQKGTIENQISLIGRMMDYLFLDADVKRLTSSGLSSYERLNCIDNLDRNIRANLLLQSDYFVNEINIYALDGRTLYTFTDSLRRSNLQREAIQALPSYDKAMHSTSTVYAIVGNEVLHNSSFEGVGASQLLAIRQIMDSSYSQPIGIAVLHIVPEFLIANSSQNGATLIIPNDHRPFLSYDGASFDTLKRDDTFYRNGRSRYLVFPIKALDALFVGEVPSIYHTADFFTVIMVTLSSILVGFLVALASWHHLDRTMIQYINAVSEKLALIQDSRFEKVSLSPPGENEVSSLVHNYNHMVDEIQYLIKRNIEEVVSREEAEYQALRMQIHPHFLYNALNTIRWMAIINHASNIQEFSERLSALLRTISKSEQKANYCLRDELECVKEYVIIQQIAQGFRFTFSFTVDDEVLLDTPCLNFFLQPIVENAILHGIGEKEGKGTLCIHVYQEREEDGDVVAISVFDDGVGFSVEEKKEKLTSIGLSNVRKRLQSKYGQAFAPQIQSQIGEFTEVIVRIPREDGHAQ